MQSTKITEKPSMSQETVEETKATVSSTEPVKTEKAADVQSAPSKSVSLTTDQEKLLIQHEETIGNHTKSFYKAGLALKAIKAEGLYVPFGSFEKYCQEKWDLGTSHADRLIDAAKVMDELKRELPKGFLLPLYEGQVRPLTQLPISQLVDVWKNVVKAAGDKPVTAQLVVDVIDNKKAGRKESKTAKKNGQSSSNVAKVNDILTLVAKAQTKAKSETVSQVKTLLKRIEAKLKKLKTA